MKGIKELEYFVISNSKYIIAILLIILIAAVVTRIGRMIMSRILKKSSENDPGERTRIRFFKNAISVIVWSIAVWMIIYTIPQFRAVAITLFAGAGILVAIIGFAAQSAFANIIAGVLIVYSRPFRVGDLIKVGNEHHGFVDDITLRHTVLNDFQNRKIIIPNSVVGNAVILNSTIGDPKVCEFIEMGISYESDIDLAMKIMQEEIRKHPDFVDNRTATEIIEGVPAIIVKNIGFGDSSVNLRAYAWVQTASKSYQFRYDAFKAIKARFDESGISIPYPHRTIVYKNDEGLRSSHIGLKKNS